MRVTPRGSYLFVPDNHIHNNPSHQSILLFNMSQQQKPAGPPYAPRVASVGGVPSVMPDVPVSAVLIAVYLGFAATNMTIFQINRRKQYKFLPTLFLFAFSMARVATLVLRIAWANRQHNVRLSIAANIFSAAGVLIIYVINLVLAQRILRAERPNLGWNMVVRTVIKVFYAGIGAALIMVITATILSVYTLNTSTLLATRSVQRAAGIYLLVFTTLPAFCLIAAQFAPSSGEKESFGQGSMSLKKAIIASTTCIAIINSGFKVGTAWMPPRPINNPAWYQSKACFYVFNFALEIIALLILTSTRIDRLFWVPNGSKRAGDYTNMQSRKSEDEQSANEQIEKV